MLTGKLLNQRGEVEINLSNIFRTPLRGGRLILNTCFTDDHGYVQIVFTIIHILDSSYLTDWIRLLTGLILEAYMSTLRVPYMWNKICLPFLGVPKIIRGVWWGLCCSVVSFICCDLCHLVSFHYLSWHCRIVFGY